MGSAVARKTRSSKKSGEAFHRSIPAKQSISQPVKQRLRIRLQRIAISNERANPLISQSHEKSRDETQGYCSTKDHMVPDARLQRQASSVDSSKPAHLAGKGPSNMPSSDDMPFNVNQDITNFPSGVSDSDLDDEYVRCICGATEDDPYHAMICCDGCTAWQHNVCMDLPEFKEDLPETYYCEMCRPQDHCKTLRALRRGERIWMVRFEKTWESKVITNFRNKIQA